MELPELPAFFAYPTGDIPHACVCGSWPGGACLRCPAINFYTADQMTAYGQECARMAVEACARICEGERVGCDGNDGDAAYNLAIEHCAAAIRATTVSDGIQQALNKGK